jgi:hypothetical protein
MPPEVSAIFTGPADPPAPPPAAPPAPPASPAAAGPAAPPPPGPDPAALIESTAPAAPPPGAAEMAQLGAAVEVLGKNLTVVTGIPDFKVVLGGVITADFLFNSARPVSPGVPFFLFPAPTRGFDQETFDAHARATTLAALVAGPRLGAFETSGVVVVCFLNDALIVDRYGVLPIQAYAQLKNDHWRFAAGLQFDIFNPLNPTVLPFSYLGGSGNAGAGFPGQVRAERYLRPSDDSQVTLTVGLSEPLPTTVNNNLRISEDNGFPTAEARAALALGSLVGEGPTARRPFEWGVSGVAGEIRTSDPGRRQVVANVWGVGSDARWGITDCFGVQGEVFVGQTLGMYTAGVLQNVNSITLEGIRAAGGWVEVYYYLCPEKLHTHVGYGVDDPLDSTLGLGQIVRNETYFANLIWDATKYIRVGWEVTYRKTAYTVLGDNDGVGFHTQVQWKF